MSQSERLRLVQEAATKYVSRNKCVDSSLMTLIVQSKASSKVAPVTVLGKQNRDMLFDTINQTSCAGNLVMRGKGTNQENTAIIQGLQASAVGAPCSNNPSDTGVNPHIVLPTPCINFNAPPFTQQNLSTMYVARCTNPGKLDYFPPVVSNGPGCTTTKITTPSG